MFGPVFQTPGKTEVRGIDAFREVCARVAPFPVLAIGGVDAKNVNEILSAGASGVAAIRALNEPGSMRVIVQKLDTGRNAQHL